MKEIQLTKGQVALVSDEDYQRVNQFKWYASYQKTRDGYVAVRKVNKKQVYMHRFIMGVTDPKIDVDHKFHNTLDNQREHLRVCTSTQNQHNRRINKGTRRFKGVNFHKKSNNWDAKIIVNKKAIHLGKFQSEESAALAYNQAAINYFGEFAYINQLTESELTIANTKPSRIRGVCWNNRERKWCAQIYINKKMKHIGYFESQDDAAIAYASKAAQFSK